MTTSPLTLPVPEQRQPPSSGPGTTIPAPRSPWARVRADLMTWLVLNDLCAVALPAWVVAGVRRPEAALPVLLTGLLMIVTAWLLGALGMDTIEQGSPSAGHLLTAGLATVPAAALLAGMPVAELLAGTASTATPTETAVFMGLAAQVILAMAGRQVESAWLRRRRLEGYGLRRTLIIMGPGAQPMLTHLRRHPMDGFLIVGYLSSGQEASVHPAAPVRSPQHIASVVRAEQIDVVMTVGSVLPEDLVTVMRGLESTQTRLIVAPGLQDVVPGRMRGLSITNGWTGLIAVRTRRTRDLGKSLFDRLVGSLLLLAASPLLLVTALAVRLDSAGPAFYAQERVGREGVPFTMWKFRSMYSDADQRRDSVVSAGGDAGNEVMFKDREDPRITRVGRTIRRLSIDELPQLLNVVRGEMSLVGPRPALPHEVEQYDAEARRRLLVKPGMTGLWQVSGRSDLSWASTVALDRHYVDNRGGALDARIFADTLRAVIGGKGAY
ncbi:sugar transferase [Actinomyces wuliandei]|uniref:sugar transferase n=1 Tax=Actinomyces wuliandei TaxID=2057743 RepID=UPI000FDB738E|nr:sugar transferase [Actinomyces wuliandei]